MLKLRMWLYLFLPRNKVFEEVISERYGIKIILDLGWALNRMTGAIIKTGEDTERCTEKKAMGRWSRH